MPASSFAACLRVLCSLLFAAAVYAAPVYAAESEPAVAEKPDTPNGLPAIAEKPLREIAGPAIAEKPSRDVIGPAVAETPVREIMGPAIAEKPVRLVESPAIAEKPVREQLKQFEQLPAVAERAPHHQPVAVVQTESPLVARNGNLRELDHWALAVAPHVAPRVWFATQWLLGL